MSSSLFAMLALAAGVCVAMQAAANSRLRHTLHEPLWATYCSILGTMIFATIAMVVLRPTLPSLESLRQTHWWHWIGGPLGAVIVLAGTVAILELGAARFIALIIAGQVLASLVLDHVGALGLARETITLGKAAGALLVILGVACIKWL